MLTCTLGQSGSSIGSMLIWVVLLIVVVVIGGVLLVKIRGKMLGLSESSAGASGLLDHLRVLHRAGELSDEEFASARASVLDKIQEERDARKQAENERKAPDLSEFEEFL